MGEKAVTFSTDGKVGIITIDKPPANSYDMDYIKDLDAAVQAAATDDSVKVVLLRSASEKFFSAGADVKAFQANSNEDNLAMINFAHQVLNSIADIPKIFIAVINGHAMGGGLEISLACDLRFAGDGKYRLGLPEVALGLLPGMGGTQRLPRLIGKHTALKMMITGDSVTPQEAFELGIVDQLLPAESVWEESLAYAQKLAGGATMAIGHIKRAVNDGSRMSLEEGLKLERELVGELFESEDAAEGLAAFSEKRQANFKGS